MCCICMVQFNGIILLLLLDRCTCIFITVVCMQPAAYSVGSPRLININEGYEEGYRVHTATLFSFLSENIQDKPTSEKNSKKKCM